MPNVFSRHFSDLEKRHLWRHYRHLHYVPGKWMYLYFYVMYFSHTIIHIHQWGDCKLRLNDPSVSEFIDWWPIYDSLFKATSKCKIIWIIKSSHLSNRIVTCRLSPWTRQWCQHYVNNHLQNDIFSKWR